MLFFMGPVFRPPAQTSLPLSPSKLSTPPPPSLLRSLAVAMAWRNWSAESCAKCQRSSSLNASLETKWLNGQSKPLVNSQGTKIADTSAELMGTLTPPIWQTIRVFDAAHVQFMLKILMGSIAPTSPSYTCYTEGVQRQNHKVVCDVNDLSKQKTHASWCQGTFTWQCMVELGLFPKWPFWYQNVNLNHPKYNHPLKNRNQPIHPILKSVTPEGDWSHPIRENTEVLRPHQSDQQRHPRLRSWDPPNHKHPRDPGHKKWISCGEIAVVDHTSQTYWRI